MVQQDKMTPIYRLPQRGVDKGTIVAVTPDFALATHSSVLPCVSVVPPELLTTSAQGDFLQVSESVHKIFKENFWVFRLLLFHPDGQNPHSYSQLYFVGTPPPGTGILHWGGPMWN